MPAEKPSTKTAGVSDEAVKKATGKTWREWVALLDKAGAKQMTHKEIVALLRDRHGVGPWWQQMVTVGYEQARQDRRKGQMADGYQVSATKTVAVPLADLFAAWADEASRARWLGRKPVTVRGATANKSLRLAWGQGASESRVVIGFYAKGPGKSQVAIEHQKLADAAEAEKMKALWRAALDKMKGVLEG